MIHSDLNRYAIVADIGGTFARFSRVDLHNLDIDKIEIYPCSGFINLESVFVTYQAQHSLEYIKQVAMAIACPVIGDLISMTNCHWNFSISELKQKLGLSRLIVMNDFNAIAMSLPALTSESLTQIGSGHPEPGKVRVVLGAGTGLGVAYLLPNQNVYSAYAGEGGHGGWGARTEQEWFIYNYLKNIYNHVSYERLLSGQGLENIYKAIAAYHHQEVALLQAAEIITLAVEQQCPIAQKTIAQFFSCLGTFSGDLALTFGAFGGIYIAGGIVPRLLSLIHKSDFRECFENKGRFTSFNRSIPTYIITAAQPGILGAAVCLKHSLSGAFDLVY